MVKSVQGKLINSLHERFSYILYFQPSLSLSETKMKYAWKKATSEVVTWAVISSVSNGPVCDSGVWSISPSPISSSEALVEGESGAERAVVDNESRKWKGLGKYTRGRERGKGKIVLYWVYNNAKLWGVVW